jgi:hypothetical protein
MKLLLVGLFVPTFCLLSDVAQAQTASEVAATRGRQYLADMLDSNIGMLPEFPGSNVYWLSHDNYLALKLLEKSHPEIAKTIREAIDREGFSQSDGKTELLCGETRQVLPFRHYNLKEIRREGDKVIRNEVATDRVLTGWEKYADLLFIAAVAEPDAEKARGYFETGMKMWDGNGFVDSVYSKHKIYATYKLALAAIASKRVTPNQQLPAELGKRLLAAQNEAGGWVTDYNAAGKLIGYANVETTCLAVLAVEVLDK